MKNTPAEKLISKFISSTTDTKQGDKIQDEEEITVKIVMDRTGQHTHNKTHQKEFIPEKEINRKKAVYKIARWNGWKTTQSKSCYFCAIQKWTLEPKSPEKQQNCDESGNNGHIAIKAGLNRENKPSRKRRRHGGRK